MATSILIVNLAVLAAVLLADLGTRTITWRRVLRPVIVAAIAVAVFVGSPQTSGAGFDLELGGLAGGLLLGSVASHLLMAIRRDPRTGEQVSVAGVGYAAFWIVVIGARLVFTYGANHWYSHPLGQWLAANAVTVAALTDALILFAIGLVLARVIRFARVLRSSRGRSVVAMSRVGAGRPHRGGTR